MSDSIMFKVICLLTSSVLCASGNEFATSNNSPVQVHTGKNFIWYIQQGTWAEEMKPFFDYADKVWDKIAEWWGSIPVQTRFYLWVHNLRGQGKDGFAGHISALDSVVGKRVVGAGVIDDAFFTTMHGIKGFRAYQLINQETVNLLNALVVSAGWPVDWWANHRSPFPAMVSVEVERALVPEVSFHSEMWFHNPPSKSPPDKLPPELHQIWAKETKAVEEEQRLYSMFKDLKDMYGWIMFRKMFTMMRDDGIDLQRIGENPSTILTSYVTAYLTLGAGEDILDYFHAGGCRPSTQK